MCEQAGNLGASLLGGHRFRIVFCVHGGLPAVQALFARPVWGYLCREEPCCATSGYADCSSEIGFQHADRNSRNLHCADGDTGMNLRFVDNGWGQVLKESVRHHSTDVCLMTPFIKRKAAQQLLGDSKPDRLRVITRFALDDFARGVSDLSALRWLLDHGASVRGIRHLHAKVYAFGSHRAAVTSANLTLAAMERNHEFGIVADTPEIVAKCRDYFDSLWNKAGEDLTGDQLVKWDEILTAHLATHAAVTSDLVLPDEGVDLGFSRESSVLPAVFSENDQAFVKFFGESHNRTERSLPILEEVRRSGCHWACTYPKGKRPRQVRDGSLMFMGRMVKDPPDIIVYGRAIGMHHRKGRDDATPKDVELRPWKERWPHYIRVHHAEFLAGTLKNGPSLNELMDTFGSDAFLPTQRNARRGKGNTNPRTAYRQQAAVALTKEAAAWLNEKLEDAILEWGKLPAAELATLDQPDVKVPPKV